MTAPDRKEPKVDAIGWLYRHEDTEGWKFTTGRPSRPGDPTFERMQVYPPALAAEVEALQGEVARLREALKRCKFDSLNMSLADLEFCRATLARAERDV